MLLGWPCLGRRLGSLQTWRRAPQEATEHLTGTRVLLSQGTAVGPFCPGSRPDRRLCSVRAPRGWAAHACVCPGAAVGTGVQERLGRLPPGAAPCSVNCGSIWLSVRPRGWKSDLMVSEGPGRVLAPSSFCWCLGFCAHTAPIPAGVDTRPSPPCGDGSPLSLEGHSSWWIENLVYSLSDPILINPVCRDPASEGGHVLRSWEGHAFSGTLPGAWGLGSLELGNQP